MGFSFIYTFCICFIISSSIRFRFALCFLFIEPSVALRNDGDSKLAHRTSTILFYFLVGTTKTINSFVLSFFFLFFFGNCQSSRNNGPRTVRYTSRLTRIPKVLRNDMPSSVAFVYNDKGLSSHIHTRFFVRICERVNCTSCKICQFDKKNSKKKKMSRSDSERCTLLANWSVWQPARVCVGVWTVWMRQCVRRES